MDKDLKVAIVTGGTGFIGSNLILKLIASGYTDILCIDRNNNFFEKFDIEPVKLIYDDIVNSKVCWCRTIKDGTRLLFLNYEIGQDSFSMEFINDIFNFDNSVPIELYHCASPVGVDNHKADRYKEAVVINEKIYNYCRDVKFPITLNFMSTSEIYGNIDIPTKDRKAFSSVNGLPYNECSKYFDFTFFKGVRASYIRQKIEAEMLFLTLNCQVNIFRLFNIIGPDQDPAKGIVAKLIKILMDDTTFMYLTNDANRTYTSIQTAVETIVSTNNNFNPSGKFIRNVVTPDNCLSNKKLLRLIINVMFELKLIQSARLSKVDTITVINNFPLETSRIINDGKILVPDSYEIEFEHKILNILGVIDHDEITTRKVGGFDGDNIYDTILTILKQYKNNLQKEKK